MARYIDAIELLKGIEDIYGRETTYGIIKDLIKSTPTADVVEVKHGYWKQNPYCERIFYCSECNRHIEDATKIPYEHFPYCHCGAKMVVKLT